MTNTVTSGRPDHIVIHKLSGSSDDVLHLTFSKIRISAVRPQRIRDVFWVFPLGLLARCHLCMVRDSRNLPKETIKIVPCRSDCASPQEGDPPIMGNGFRLDADAGFPFDPMVVPWRTWRRNGATCQCNTLIIIQIQAPNVRWCKMPNKQIVRYRKIVGRIRKACSPSYPLFLQQEGQPGKQVRPQRKSPATDQGIKMHEAMKRNNGKSPSRRHEEELGFLDDRIQLLETVREMICIEIKQRGLDAIVRSHPAEQSTDDATRESSRGGMHPGPSGSGYLARNQEEHNTNII